MRLLILLLPLTALFSAADISWETDFEAALARAKAENKVLFCALNMDGEKANDRMAKDVYSDKEVIALTQYTVNLIGSRFEHGGKCKRFSGITCADHQQMEKHIRANVLNVTPQNDLVAPQHIFSDASGKILLSVPYEISASELQWCLATAILKANPDADVKMPDKARAPRRLIQDGVLSGGSDTAITPLSEDDVESTIKAIRNGMRADARAEAMLRLLATDDKTAIEFVDVELGDARIQRRKPLLVRMIRAMGAVSPQSFSPTLERFLKYPDTEIRMEAVVALEQIGNKKIVKEIRSVYGKEGSARVRAQMIRAIGIIGVDDKSARSAVIKAAKDKKDDVLASNALFALGLHASDKKAWTEIEVGLSHTSTRRRQAAALGLALGRASGRIDAVRAARKIEKDEEAQATFDAVIAVLEGGPISGLANISAKVTDSEIPRPRFFGGQTGAEETPSE
ncbi:MAG: HEAT repeat domain-containing protein [Planctomycetes bacterium]|nr:HEAT repeat domain-containing protein [Planctomycetota bacterium]